jgi:hypothetical protein
MNLCVCLIIAQLTFLIGIDMTSARPGCSVAAGILQYFLLAAFAISCSILLFFSKTQILFKFTSFILVIIMAKMDRNNHPIRSVCNWY